MKEIKAAMPQRSVLEPPSFNIFINDVLFLMNGTGICNYAYDTILYSYDNKIEIALQSLKMNATNVKLWLKEKQTKSMKINIIY